ncbi:hypothetical protein Q8W71_30730 [Methylobacterium sp. NEAU 140]|uniref:hypothetical protein n=1 Tax=Methylobacterium sp. NEAU 140 TaxID=3064945 RepID=UPI002736914E|nr:hypothetical protein [Methylobacterium sp. NEAU 140]MDP4026968.1 hypothetical protein [Methylobacterium sp. NEAU 140]
MPVRDFRFCVALRDRDGMLGGPLHEEVITAQDAADAVARAMAIELDMPGLKANALYLVDPDGCVVWSLRLADVAGPE